jgi:signal transduction histidine kinase
VRWPAATPKQLLAIGLACAGLACAAWLWRGSGRAETVVPTHSFSLHDGQMGEWKAIGGKWEIVDGVMRSESSTRGAKLMAGSNHWSDYTLTSDIRFDGTAADMGVMIRSNDETVGTDTYNGYFVGFRNLDGTLVIGRANYGEWVEARPVPIPGGVSPGVWYRLRVTAFKCHIAASAQNLTTLQTAWIAFEERSCVKSGRIGLRSLNADGMWRNISVGEAGWNDYLELQRHATSVEQPAVYQGPPWWTPWHVGMLFAAVLTLALLVQLAYFRIQQWKAFAITQERERLAHEIHDTMAQSFAGVGYQIQGIRRSVIRGNYQDSRVIADQLSVAYQLVRKCHEEAGRTIAMFSTSLPLTPHNLLEALARTARRIGGEQIKIVTRLNGNSSPLTLRVADALLHIGQEAIANAVSHADPTVLTISLSFEGSDVELAVEDNGQGFDYTPAVAGFGVLGMQKRAQAVAGRLQIDSVAGAGTILRVRAGLEEENLRTRVLTLIKKKLA